MNRIALMRKERNLTQKELGAIIGVAQNTVCNWENGKREPDYESLKKMAFFFNCSTDYLLGTTPFGRTFVFDDKLQIDENLDWAGQPRSKVEKNEAPIPEAETGLDVQLSGIDFALSGEIHDLTDAEKQDILDYIRFKKSQRGGEKK